MTDPALHTLITTTSAALLAYIALWSGLQTFNANPTKRFMRIWVKLALYYAAYTMPVWVILLIMVWSQELMPMLAQLSLSAVLMAKPAHFVTDHPQSNVRSARSIVDKLVRHCWG